VAVYFLFPDILNSGSNGEPTSSIGDLTVPQTPEPLLIDSGDLENYIGVVIEASKECGNYYCMKVELLGDRNLVSVKYDKRAGEFYEGGEIEGRGKYMGNELVLLDVIPGAIDFENEL